jgi:signal transduction histidine kinase
MDGEARMVWGIDMNREKAMFSKWAKIFLVFGSSVLIAWLHAMLIHDQITYSVLEELYYVPLLLGALMFGLRGALLTYLLVSVLYLLHAYINWELSLLGWVDRLQHLLFSGIFTFLAGYLVDRERKSRKQLEKAQYLAGIGKVATTIVHDLKNPLITILGFAKRIKEKKGNTDSAI